jgi:hypothetical protein
MVTCLSAAGYAAACAWAAGTQAQRAAVNRQPRVCRAFTRQAVCASVRSAGRKAGYGMQPLQSAVCAAAVLVPLNAAPSRANGCRLRLQGARILEGASSRESCSAAIAEVAAANKEKMPVAEKKASRADRE